MKRLLAITISFLCLFFLCSCSNTKNSSGVSDKAFIEETLNLKNNSNQEWSYDTKTNSWTLAPVTSVAYPEIAEKEGVSVNVPGEYVSGIDTNADNQVEINSENYQEAVKGSLILNSDAQITSSNGQSILQSIEYIIKYVKR